MGTFILLLDGAADDKIYQLGGKTPLEASRKPFIDNIASRGLLCSTDSKQYTHAFLLEFLTGRNVEVPRGVIEALGLGLSLKDGEVVYRLSPAMIMDGEIIEWCFNVPFRYRDKVVKDFINELTLKSKFNFRVYIYDKVGLRGLLVLKDQEVIDTPSPARDINVSIDSLDTIGKPIVNVALRNNGLTLIPWGGGSLDKTINLNSKIKPLTIVSRSPSVLGVASLLRLKMVKGRYLSYDLLYALKILKEHDNVLLHVEETDIISHMRRPDLKVRLIEKIDSLLLNNADVLKGHKVLILVDHGTSSITGKHLESKVPLAYATLEHHSDVTVRTFSESVDCYIPLNLLARVI